MSTPETDGITVVRGDEPEALFAPEPKSLLQAAAEVTPDAPVYDRDGDNLVGQALRARRRFLGLRQEDIASRMGVSRGLVSQWEQGTTRIMAGDLTRLAEALGVTVGDLFGHPDVSNLIWACRRGNAANEGELAKVLRREHQERMLLSVFDAMTDEQRERLVRVAQALRE